MPKLRNRREHRSAELIWRNQVLHVGFGFDGEGRVREMFVAARRAHSDIEALLTDACVLASHHLQRGMDLSDLLERVSREGLDDDAAAASVLGAAVRLGLDVEAEAGPQIAARAQAHAQLKSEEGEAVT